MCDPVAGGQPHHPIIDTATTEKVESGAQTASAASEQTHHASSAETETASKNAATAGAQGGNWLEEAEKIKAPSLGASQNEWIAHAEKLAKTAGITEGMVTDMIRTKSVSSPVDSHAADDGTGEQVHGLLSVHGGLLEGGVYGETSHALKDSAGNALTAADMKDPGKATLAGVKHLKQLIDHYGGDETSALNHYQTGDKADNNHPLKDWCDGTSCSDEAGGGHGAEGGHHAADSKNSGVFLKSSSVLEQLASAGNKGDTESAGAGHHAASATASQSAQAHGQHSESAGAGHHADSATASQSAQAHGQHSETAGGHQQAHAAAQGNAAVAAKPGATSHTGHGAATTTENAGSQTMGAAGGEHAQHGGGAKHGLTGLGTDRSLGEYITPDSHSPSEHIGESHGLGFLMHRPTHDAAMETVFGKPASEVISSIQSTLENTGTYLTNKPDTEKIKGAYLTGNMLMKQAMLPASSFGSETEAGSVYAQAKLTAINGDVAGLKSLIESNGGDTFGLTDEQLLNVWATNEHNNLHGILDAGSQIGQSIHMTSLNDGAKDGTAKGTLGGYNDKGAYPQWGWFEDAKGVASQFGLQARQAQAA